MSLTEFNHQKAADRMAATIRLVNENRDLSEAIQALTLKNTELEEELKRVIQECYSAEGEAAVEMMLPAWPNASEIVRGKMSSIDDLITSANVTLGAREGKLCRSCGLAIVDQASNETTSSVSWEFEGASYRVEFENQRYVVYRNDNGPWMVDCVCAVIRNFRPPLDPGNDDILTSLLALNPQSAVSRLRGRTA